MNMRQRMRHGGAPVGMPALGDATSLGTAGAPWMTPESVYDGYDTQRFRAWRDRSGGVYSEDFYVYTTANVASIASGASAQTYFNVQKDSAFEWIGVMIAGVNPASATYYTSQLNLAMQITDGGPSRNLFSQPVPVAALCGGAAMTYGSVPNGSLAHILPVPKIFLPMSTVSISLYNYDTVNAMQNVQLSFIGRKIYTSRRPDLLGNNLARFKSWQGNDGRTYAQDYYAYVLNLATLAAAGNGLLNWLIEADSDFEWILTEACMNGGIATGFPSNAFAAVTAQFKDGGSDRNLFSNNTPIPVWAGMGANPIINPIPRIFLGKTPVTVSVQNGNASAMAQIYFVLEGRKIFDVTRYR